MQVATQDAQIRDILAKLELVSHGTVQAWNSAGGPDSDGPGTPPGEGKPPHITYRADYLEADTFDARQQVIDDATKEWGDLTGQSHKERPVGETLDEFNQRIIDDGYGLTLTECALKFRCSKTQARKARLAKGRIADTGHEPGDDQPATIDDTSRVRDLKAKGMSIRQIAMITGHHRRKIERMLAA